MIEQLSVGQCVCYGGTGVCRVERIETVPFPDEQHMRKCCELKPVGNPSMAILVPLDNAALCAKIKPLLSKQEIDRMISALPDLPSLWMEERKQRAAEFRRILSAGDAQTLLQLLYTLKQQREILRQNGKKLASADLLVWKEAVRVIDEEFAYSLGIRQQDVLAYISDQLQTIE